jgi:hypothetical protein
MILEITIIVELIALVAVVLWQGKYFHWQRKDCQKYSFFKFRDKVITEIARSQDVSGLTPLYEKANAVIEKLQVFGLRFYTFVLIHSMVIHMQELAKHHWRRFSDSEWKSIKAKFHPLELEFSRLILMVARENSFLIRLATTRIGSKILFLMTMALTTIFVKFRAKHPNILRRQIESARALRAYACLWRLAIP